MLQQQLKVRFSALCLVALFALSMFSVPVLASPELGTPGQQIVNPVDPEEPAEPRARINLTPPNY